MLARLTLCAPLAAALVVLAIDDVGAQDAIARVRELYESAAYEDALQILDTHEHETTKISPSGRQVIDEYRALCLLALNRADDAETVLRRILWSNPLYVPSAADPVPRFAKIVQSVRNDVVPEVAHRRYAEAKATADRRRFDAATNQLEELLRIIRQDGLDRDVIASLGDLTRDATQLLAISRRSQTVYMSGDAGVVPATAIRQLLPDPSPVRERIKQSYLGQLEVIIDAAGDVESAAIATPSHPDYDALLLTAAKAWKYRPAQKNGRAVPWRSVMTIQLAPQERR